MIITRQGILDVIESEFTETYKPFSQFKDSGLVWDECIKAAGDVTLMNNIIFCNDVLKIPPVKTFLMANENIMHDLNNEEKKAMGAFFGFLFKFILGYSMQKKVSVRVNSVKSATYFQREVGEKVVIVEEIPMAE